MVHVAHEVVLRLVDVPISRLPHVLAPYVRHFLMQTRLWGHEYSLAGHEARKRIHQGPITTSFLKYLGTQLNGLILQGFDVCLNLQCSQQQMIMLIAQNTIIFFKDTDEE